MHPENCQLKPTLLGCSTDRNVYVECVFKIFLHPLRQRIALLRSAKLIFALLKFIVSEYDSCRFSASFWTIFVKPGAAPPVHAKISGTKLLCSTSRIFSWYFNVLTLMMFVGVRYSFRAGFSMWGENFYVEKGSTESASQESICLDVKSSVIFSSRERFVCCGSFCLPTFEVSALFQHHSILLIIDFLIYGIMLHQQ